MYYKDENMVGHELKDVFVAFEETRDEFQAARGSYPDNWPCTLFITRPVSFWVDLNRHMDADRHPALKSTVISLIADGEATIAKKRAEMEAGKPIEPEPETENTECKACRENPMKGALYPWKNAKVEMAVCEQHWLEIRWALDDAQAKDKARKGASHGPI